LTWRIQLDVVALGLLIPRRGVLIPSIDNITTIAAAAQCHPAEPVIRVEPVITVERDATKASRSPKLPNASYNMPSTQLSTPLPWRYSV